MNLIEVWKDTEDYCDNELKESTVASTKNQTVYLEKIELLENAPTYKNTEIKVTHNDTITAALKANGKIAIHNFASATNPGGGTTSGSRAQEECICRCTNLLPCLYDSDDAWDNYYQYHRNLKNNRYTDRCIYTPDVIIFKNKDYQRVEPKTVNVITCAAPNLRVNPNNKHNPGNGEAIQISDSELFDIHKQRAKQILNCAILNGCDSIILGAFGCGAFQNKPDIVAMAYNDVIQKYKKYFKYIEFAVYCGKEYTNYDMFNRFIQR